MNPRKELRAALDSLAQSCKIPSEYSRRARKYTKAKTKASEWWHLIRVLGPPLAHHILMKEDRDRAKVFLLLSFLYSAMDHDGREFQRLEESHDMNYLFQLLYYTYDHEYGSRQVTYNQHLWMAHGYLLRKRHGPCHKVSAVKYESYYSRMNNSYVLGTTGTAVQAVENHYITDTHFHVCLHKRQLR